MSETTTAGGLWPQLRVDDWAETRDTVHMWLQILGKVALRTTPLQNQWWNVALELTARGLRTRLMETPTADVDAELDVVDHRLVLRSTDGGEQWIPLSPMTVADFYAQVRQALQQLGLDVDIVARPNEVEHGIPFVEDTTHDSYDPDAMNAAWRQLISAARVMRRFQASFGGKQSPVQLFWGSNDLSQVRFSGRSAPRHDSPPPNCPAWVMEEAESMENSAVGFWAGAPGEEGTFYAYAYPAPEGYEDADLSPARYDGDLGEWVLPYEVVRTSDDPDATLLRFLQQTYDLAADKGGWDRASLDLDPDRLATKLDRR